MNYLKKFDISNDTINLIKTNNDTSLIRQFIIEENNVSNVLKYFKSIGINVVDLLLIYRSDLFFMNVNELKSMFSKYNLDEVVDSINKDIDYINEL